jgi:hypothetical protein
MRNTIKTILLAGTLVAGGIGAASAQTYAPAPLPGETNTPADIVTVPLGVGAATAGAILGAPFEGRSVAGPRSYGNSYNYDMGAAPGNANEDGHLQGHIENPVMGN